MVSKRANRIINSTKSTPIKMPTETPLGSAGYDNPRDDIEKVKKIREGSIEKAPVFDNDIVNKAYLNNVINTGIFIIPTLTDEGGLNVSWSTGQVYSHTTMEVIDTEAGSGTCTDDAINFLVWKNGTTLTLQTTRGSEILDEIDIGHFHCVAGDVVDGIHIESILCERETHIANALAQMFPLIVTSGLICSEHVGDNAFDIDSSAGEYYHDGHERHTITAIESITTNIIRHFKTAGATDTDSNSQIDPTKYNNGTNLVAVTANKFYRSTFAIAPDSVIHWIYPDTQYNTVGEAIDGVDPEIPGGLVGFPKTTSLILRGDDAALPAAGEDQWIDVRELVRTTSVGIISDHVNLASIGTNTHEEIDTALGNLTGDVMADSQHRHSELSASDGSPNPALSVNADGKPTVGNNTNGAVFELSGKTAVSNNYEFDTTLGNRLAIKIGGTEKAHINDSGSLHLGNNTDGSSLELNGKAGTSNNYKLDTISGNKLSIKIGGNEKISIDGNGNAWFIGDVSALTFTDRTPFYDGDAISEIKLIKGKSGEIDHTTLPEFVKVEKENTTERNLGNMISVLTKAVQQLTARIEALES